jgi:hypothetical protein
MDFLRYMASVEGQTALVRQFGPNAGILPVNRQVDPENLSPTTRQGLTVVQDADHIGRPYVSGWVPGRFWGQAFSAFSKFLRNPDNYEAALTDLERARQQTYEE